jgi:hypothetical protein
VNGNSESVIGSNNKQSDEARTELRAGLEEAKLQEHINNIESSSKYIKFKQGYDSKLLRLNQNAQSRKIYYRTEIRAN